MGPFCSRLRDRDLTVRSEFLQQQALASLTYSVIDLLVVDVLCVPFLDPVSMHGPKQNIYHKQMNNGVLCSLEVV